MTMLRRMMLTALVLFVLLTAAALADTNDFTFTPNGSGDGYVVTGYSGSETTVTVPDWYNDLPVTEIGSGAFQGKTDLKAVSLPSTIVRIGASAFRGCSSLSKVTSYAASAEPTPPTVERVPGDADGNGKVDLHDALLVLQYDAGWSVSIDKNNADVDANGAVTLEDALLIFRYGAGVIQ